MKPARQTRLLIVEAALKRYRVPFYDQLHEELSNSGIVLRVAHGQSWGQRTSRADDSTEEHAWSIRLAGRNVGFPGARGLVRLDLGSVLRSGPVDLVILDQVIRQLETYPLALGASRSVASIAFWGHGKARARNRSVAEERLRMALTRSGDWFFAYTQGAADLVSKQGFPRSRITVVNNAPDTAALCKTIADIPLDRIASYRAEFGLQRGMTALFVGGVDREKGIDFLINAARVIEQSVPGFRLLVGGSGSDVDLVRAAELGGAPIRYLGALEGEAKALAFASSDVMAIPQSVGLAAVESLATGRPLVTTDWLLHGPELEYLVSGVTSVFTTHNAAAYGQAIGDLLSNPDRMEGLSVAGKDRARTLGTGPMVHNMAQGILEWDDVRKAGLIHQRLLGPSLRRISRQPVRAKETDSASGKIAVLVACHNRKEQTLACMAALFEARSDAYQVCVWLVDDGSTDGTAEAVASAFPAVCVIAGSGDLFWAGAMSVAEKAALRCDPSLFLWLNDDVILDRDALQRLVSAHVNEPCAIIAGATRGTGIEGVSYGGRRSRKFRPQAKTKVAASTHTQRVDAFNGNAALIPRTIRDAVGPIDGAFAHAYADDDYSARAAALEIEILQLPGTIGTCKLNVERPDLPTFRQAWRFLQSPKGLPLGSQVRYLRRHAGPAWPAYLFYTYLRRMLGRRA